MATVETFVAVRHHFNELLIINNLEFHHTRSVPETVK